MPKHIAQGKQQPKFERIPCVRNRDNCDIEGRRTNLISWDLMRYSNRAKKNGKCVFSFSNIQKTVRAYGPREATTKICKKFANVVHRYFRHRRLTDDGEFRFHELFWHSQAKLKVVSAYQLAIGGFLPTIPAHSMPKREVTDQHT